MEIFSALLATGGFHTKAQWRETLMFSLICTWTNGWANNPDAGDFGRHRTYHDVTVMLNTDFMLTSSDYLNQTGLFGTSKS